MDCPFCSYTASRHFDHQKVYWFCNHCWQEVPQYDQQPRLPEKLSSLILQTNLVEQIKSRTKLPKTIRAIAHS